MGQTDETGAALRIEALRRGLRELPLPPAAAPREYGRVWRERMRLHRAIAGLIAPAPAPAPAAEGEARDKQEARKKQDKHEKQDKEQTAWDAPWADWGGGARKTR